MEWNRIDNGYVYIKKDLGFNRRFLGEYKANTLTTILNFDEYLNIEDLLKIDFDLKKETVYITDSTKAINISSDKIFKYRGIIKFKINIKIEYVDKDGIKIISFSEKSMDYINLANKDGEVDISPLSIAVWKDKFDKMLLNLSYVILVD